MRLWSRWQRLPLGNRVFSAIISWAAPFTGTVRPLVTSLEPGRSEVTMRERRRVRQHLKSVHAGALFTLAEGASGLAMMAWVPDGARAIVTSMRISYHKKGRGQLKAVATCEMPDLAALKQPSNSGDDHDVTVHIAITDAAGDDVCSAEALWRVRPAQHKI
jgi:uncharacterized protein (TIGR00369 family)